MSLKTSLVDLDKITSHLKRSDFSEENLEQLAQMMIQVNGIIQPPILEEVSREKYEVIEGDFQYYSALKASEIDDDFEMIRAFIISDREKELIQQQLNILKQLNSQVDFSSILSATNSDNKEIRVDNLESHFNIELAHLKQEQTQKNQKLEAELSIITEDLPTKLDPLTAFNQLDSANLMRALILASLSNKEACKIVSKINHEREKKSFDSLNDVIERSKTKSGKRQFRLITEKSMIKIIDNWSKITFNV